MHYKMQELLLKGETVIATSKNVEELIAFVDQNSLMANNLSCGNSEAKKEWADLVKRIRFLVKAHNRLSEKQLEDIIRFDKTEKELRSRQQPKPLLADTGIGDIVKTNLGDWLQIVDTPCLRFGHDECYRTHDGLYWDEYGGCDVDSTYRLVAVEPLAPEGTAEWAWQMLKLQKPVSHPAEGELQDTDYTKEGFVRCMAKTGWQLYEPKPEPDKEDMHLRSGKDNPERQDFCHMYEPKPEPQYKVGDWVEIERKGKTYHKQVILIDDDGFARVEFSSSKMKIADIGETSLLGFKTIRKLHPSEVVVRIGCLSGTVEDLSYAVDGRFWLIGKATERCPVGMFALLYDEMLDTQTRELVEGLLDAQKGGEMKPDNTAKNFSVGQRVKYECYGFSGYGIIDYRMSGGDRYIVKLPTDSEYLNSIPGCCSCLIGIDAKYLTAAQEKEE